MCSKRAGTADQLYETKLLSLLYIRAIHDNDIEEFQLASNIGNIGAFGDICFKAKLKGFHKPLVVFVQAKHRENEKQTLQIDLPEYFDSYMKVRQHFDDNMVLRGTFTDFPSKSVVTIDETKRLFDCKSVGTFDETKRLFDVHTSAKDDFGNNSAESGSNTDLASFYNRYMKIRHAFDRSNKDIFFRGPFGETECLFVIYTNAKMDLSYDSVRSEFSAKLNDLIYTGGKVNTLYRYENNIESLTKIAVKLEIILLSEQIAKLITGKMNFEMLLSNEHVLRYHVILAQQVFDVSEIQPDGRCRMASVRNDFFDTNEEHLIVFKDTLFKEILKRRRIEHADITLFLSEFLADPTDARRLSKLIGTVITYNNGQLEFDKKSLKDFRPDMIPMDVSRSTVNEAVELAAREILTFQEFKVPAAFGNKDFRIRGSAAKTERRIDYIASKIYELYKNESNNVVTIDDSLGVACLRLNGGIASTIGNIFVLDDNTKLMKITDNWESLGTHAKRLYTKLIDKIHDLHKYKFCFKVDKKFPRLSFSEYAEYLARDFLNKLQIYCNQADENVEEKIKISLKDYQLNQPYYFQIKTDAIFLKYYDEIQYWWITAKRTSYLTRKSVLFQNAINKIIRDPLMNSINETFMSKIKKYNYTFTEDAVRSLKLQDQHSSTVIVAENSVLTIVKVMQHLKNRDFVVLDLEYIANLPTNDQNALCFELKFTQNEKVHILICDKIDSKNEQKSLAVIAKAGRYKRIIIITNQKSLQIINRYFPETDDILHDKQLSLIDLSKESQRVILETATAMFSGGEIRLNHLLRGWPQTGSRSVGTTPAVASAVAD